MLSFALPLATRVLTTNPFNRNTLRLFAVSTHARVATEDSHAALSLQPRELVAQLDRFIVGQAEAKKAVAVALRNRWRRQQLREEMRKEVHPKNLLMIGPTGVGKTEIARRLAKLCKSPFVKVEATKFTEVGYHGRDVDEIIKDLVEASLHEARERHKVAMRKEWIKSANKVLAKRLARIKIDTLPDQLVEMLEKGELENELVDLEQQEKLFSFPTPLDFGSMTGMPSRTDKQPNDRAGPHGNRRLTVKEAREYLIEQEAQSTSNDQKIIQDAIKNAEENGIVVIDEIDKVCTKSELRHGPDASSEGVQRDLLPLIEGCTVSTKHGNVKTDHILFIAAGAFHTCKPSDMLAELQGRLPIRVELKGLTEADLHRILVEPENNLLKQQVALMKTENVNLIFKESATKEIARIAAEINTQIQNIGARRLHTVLEKIVEHISFNAPELSGETIEIDDEYVRSCLKAMLKKTDLSKFIL